MSSEKVGIKLEESRVIFFNKYYNNKIRVCIEFSYLHRNLRKKKDVRWNIKFDKVIDENSRSYIMLINTVNQVVALKYEAFP